MMRRARTNHRIARDPTHTRTTRTRTAIHTYRNHMRNHHNLTFHMRSHDALILKSSLITMPPNIVVIIPPAGTHASDSGLTSFPIDQLVGNLVKELAGHHIVGLPPCARTAARVTYRATLRAG